MPIRTNFRVHVIGPVCQLVEERGGSVEAVLRRSSLPLDARARSVTRSAGSRC